MECNCILDTNQIYSQWDVQGMESGEIDCATEVGCSWGWLCILFIKIIMFLSMTLCTVNTFSSLKVDFVWVGHVPLL